MAALTSAPVSPIGPDDHLRGDPGRPTAILYLDLGCRHCAALWGWAIDLDLALCVRHFPLGSRRPRSPFLHAAAEAAGLLGGESAFWSLWDGLLGDQARTDDPHLWARAEAAGLDPVGFEATRRDAATIARVDRDFRGGLRAGVVGTPAAFLNGVLLSGSIEAGLEGVASSDERRGDL